MLQVSLGGLAGIDRSALDCFQTILWWSQAHRNCSGFPAHAINVHGYCGDPSHCQIPHIPYLYPFVYCNAYLSGCFGVLVFQDVCLVLFAVCGARARGNCLFTCSCRLTASRAMWAGWKLECSQVLAGPQRPWYCNFVLITLFIQPASFPPLSWRSRLHVFSYVQQFHRRS